MLAVGVTERLPPLSRRPWSCQAAMSYRDLFINFLNVNRNNAKNHFALSRRCLRCTRRGKSKGGSRRERRCEILAPALVPVHGCSTFVTRRLPRVPLLSRRHECHRSRFVASRDLDALCGGSTASAIALNACCLPLLFVLNGPPMCNFRKTMGGICRSNGL